MESNNFKSAIAIHPGEYIKDELEYLGWTQGDLAEIMGRPVKTINQIITGRSGISIDTAIQLEAAFKTSAATWLNLQSQYQLSLSTHSEYDDVKRRAKLYEQFPIREMVKRGWLKLNQLSDKINIEDLENSVKTFFNVTDLSQCQPIVYSAKQNVKNYSATELKSFDKAWIQKVKILAESQITNGKFSLASAQSAVAKLSELLLSPEEIRHVPKIFSDSGIRLIIVEALPNSKLDAVCFWLDNKSPVIGLTMRFNRIDNFWFTLRHELEHVIQGDGKNDIIIDSDVGKHSEDLPDCEKHANKIAAEFCVPQDKLESYILRSGAYIFSEKKILAFSGIHKVHSGLVVGQLQNKTGKYQMLRKHLVPVRDFILPGSTYDGWGFINEE